MSTTLILIARRLGIALLTLLLVSAVVFTISSLLPGDAAEETLGQSATPEAVAALRHQLGLDQPAPVRYANWLGGLVTVALLIVPGLTTPAHEHSDDHMHGKDVGHAHSTLAAGGHSHGTQGALQAAGQAPSSGPPRRRQKSRGAVEVD